jgi:hypothetical protein
MPSQFKVGNDLGVEQAYGVAGDRIAKTGVKGFRDGGTAHDVPALENGHFKACTREVKGADQTVVTAANYQNVACHSP